MIVVHDLFSAANKIKPKPEEARDAAGRDGGVRPGGCFFPDLQRGTRLETRMNLARFQTEPEASTLAAGGPRSRRNPWQPQAAYLGNPSTKQITRRIAPRERT